MLRCIKSSSLSLILTVFWVGSLYSKCPESDLSRDCLVDLPDVQVFDVQWLAPPKSIAELNADDIIKLYDFALMADQSNLEGIPLAINEFMASNSDCIQDPQGQCDDWIEIHNYGPDAINIGGMYLTDNLSVPTRWRIPANNAAATTIPAGGYLLIWADNDTTDAGLHANYKLDANGEEIGLFDSDGVTLIDSVIFGQQAGDISYGRYPDASDNWQLFASPSPGAENVGVYQGFVADVEFSHDPGFYDSAISLTIACETEGTSIYYSIDDTEPDIPYTSPILISETTTLRAIATKTDWKPSKIVTQAYIFLGPDVRNFSSNLPIAIVDTFDEGIGQNRQTLSFAGFIDTSTDGRARITDAHEFIGRTGINVRGKTSASWPKKQYRLETWDEYDDDKDVSILGFPAESDWILQGPYSDKSLMRNVLSYQWSNDIGRYAVRTRFIEMFLNTNGGEVSMSDYVGVYALMENIKRNRNRVDITKLDPADNTEPAITGGYIIKNDKIDSGEQYFRTNIGIRLIYVDPDSTDITPQQMAWIQNYIRNFESVLSGSGFTDPVDGYAKYIDVDSFIDHHIIVEMTKNIDGIRLSTYLYKDRGGKLNMGPVWDYNLSLGNANYYEGWRPDGWYHEVRGLWTPGYEGYPSYEWYRRLFEDPEFELHYWDRWYALRKDVYSTEKLLGDIDMYDALLDEAQARNFDRWNILGRYLWPNWFIADTHQEEINWMKQWLATRLEWIDSQFFAPPVFNRDGGQVPSGFNLTMDSPTGTIYYTLDGSDPRSSGTPQPATALVPENADKRALVPTGDITDNWKGGGVFDDSAWLSSTGSPGGVGFERTMGFEDFISLDLKEQMYATNATCYVRIPFTIDVNYTSLTLNVRYDDGFVAYLNSIEVARRNFDGTPAWNSRASASHPDSLAVDFESIDISTFLSALQQGENLLAIQAMNSSATGSDFLISAELLASGGDSGDKDPDRVREYTEPITLPQSARVKARVLSGEEWSALNEAVFAIGPVAENLRITEIMYHPQAPADANDPNEEFIELKNIGTETINLNLVSFTNGIDFTFPSIELAAGEYVVVVQDRNIFEARYGTNVNIAGQYSGRLNNAGERIELADAIGQTILNFSYEDDWHSITDGEGFSLTIINPANSDVSSWDKKDSWRPSAYAGGSPGQDDSGIIPEPGAIVINEVLAHSHAEASDWIELYNTTGTAIDIGGWFISDSNDNLFKYKIANGTTIGPNGYLVIYEDLYFGNANDPGAYEPFALSENGERLYLSSAQNDVLTGYRNVEDFGASETGVSFGRYHKSSTDNYNFVAMDENTPGSANAYPKVGPIVISEIMYHPDWPEGSSYTNDQYEYIELHNISAEPVTLYDYVTAEPWKFTDGIEFTFAGDAPVTIPAGGYLLVVKKPAAFSWRYPAVPAEIIFGPYDGNLSNAGESLELSMPGDVDKDGVRQYIRIDRVNYSDGSHPENCPSSIDLWPVEADGDGMALARKVPADYGNDPDNWQAASPTPGGTQ